MTTPDKIRAKRKESNEAHLIASRSQIERLIDRQLNANFNDEFAIVTRQYIPLNPTESLHPDAEEQVIRAYGTHGWDVLRTDTHLLFMARYLTPDQKQSIRDKLPEKDWV